MIAVFFFVVFFPVKNYLGIFIFLIYVCIQKSRYEFQSLRELNEIKWRPDLVAIRK